MSSLSKADYDKDTDLHDISTTYKYISVDNDENVSNDICDNMLLLKSLKEKKHVFSVSLNSFPC